jgi:hypothetical protein
MTSPPRLSLKIAAAAAMALVMCSGAARADVLVDDTNIVGLPSVAATSQHAFTATATDALTVTLTDFKTPAAFTSLQIAVTQNDTLVGTAAIGNSSAAAVAIAATSGSVYTLYVIGTPDTSQGIGSFGACVTRNADPTPRSCVAAYSFSGNIQTPSAPSTTGVSTLDTNFTATSTGTYQVTLTDDAFPVPLQMVSATLFNGSTQVGGVFNSGAATPATLTGGTTYSLLVAAQAAASPQAGLYGVHITDPSGAVVFDRTLPVGSLGSSTIVNNPTAQPLTLKLTDFAYPAPLSTVGAAVTSGGVDLGNLTAAGSLPGIVAPEGSVEVWQFATAASSPSVYGLSLSSSTASLLSTTQVVNPGNTTPTGSYAFVVSLPAAGRYNFSVSDFQFPNAFQSLSSTIAQNGTPLTVDSSGNFSAAVGAAIVLVNSQAPATGSGIFAVTVQTTDSPAKILLDQTQPVGGVFDTQVINYGASGSYNVTLDDLAFPTTFQNLAVVLSQGSQVLGKIYSSGTFPVALTPGQYVLTFVATPGAQDYGLYSINITSAPPVVTLGATPTSVTAGQTVQLTWTSQSTTACTASGATGWSGAEPVNGSTAVVIAASATLTLTCTGANGGSAAKSVSIAATVAPSTHSGGGGSLDVTLLALLVSVIAARRGIKRRD